MPSYHPREWEHLGPACFGHDDKPETEELLKEVGDFAVQYGALRPHSLSELYFPPRIKEVYPVYAEKAKDFCFGKDRRHPCPVRKQCLIWAIQTNEEHGILGGMSHRERNALVRKAEAEGISPEDYVNRLPS